MKQEKWGSCSHRIASHCVSAINLCFAESASPCRCGRELRSPFEQLLHRCSVSSSMACINPPSPRTCSNPSQETTSTWHYSTALPQAKQTKEANDVRQRSSWRCKLQVRCIDDSVVGGDLVWIQVRSNRQRTLRTTTVHRPPLLRYSEVFGLCDSLRFTVTMLAFESCKVVPSVVAVCRLFMDVSVGVGDYHVRGVVVVWCGTGQLTRLHGVRPVL